MGWSLPSIRRSVFTWLGFQPAEAVPEFEVIEDIREALLKLLQTADCGRFAILMRRIQYAESATELWYLRADVLTVLSGVLGEQGAGTAMAPVTALFDSIVPSAMRSRHSPLAG